MVRALLPQNLRDLSRCPGGRSLRRRAQSFDPPLPLGRRRGSVRPAARRWPGAIAPLRRHARLRRPHHRFIVYWDLQASMTEADIEIILQKGKELNPDAKPRIISDHGPQFIVSLR